MFFRSVARDGFFKSAFREFGSFDPRRAGDLSLELRLLQVFRSRTSETEYRLEIGSTLSLPSVRRESSASHIESDDLDWDNAVSFRRHSAAHF